MISKRYNEQMGNYLAKLAREKKPMTNADRIRAMTDEELAELLVMRDLSSVIKFNEALGNYAHLHYDKESSIKSVFDWLKAPVEEVKTD